MSMSSDAEGSLPVPTAHGGHRVDSMQSWWKHRQTLGEEMPFGDGLEWWPLQQQAWLLTSVTKKMYLTSTRV